jgi:RND family efflux transporter MFP subunit
VPEDRQQGRILLVAVALTFLLGGACAGGAFVHMWWQGRLVDEEFLKTLTGPAGPAGGGGPEAQPAALVRVDKARVEEVRPERRLVGRLREVRRTTVSSEITGKMVAMNVREGSPVVADKTVIASIDKVWLDLAMAQQSAHIDVIQAELRKEKHNLERLTDLLARGVATDHEHTEQLAAHDQKQAALKEARVALEDLQEQRKRVDVIAPFDGWVTVRHADRGQWLTPGSAVVDLVSRGEIYAVMNVPESLVNGLTLGMEISVRIDALGETRPGRIGSITPYGSTASRTYPVRVVLDDGGGRLKVGMSTTAVFPAGEKRKRIMVSRDGVLVKPDGATVWVVRPSEPPTAAAVPVEVTARVGERFAVEPITAAGRGLLVDAATIGIEGGERLRPGQAVRVMDAAGVAARPPGAGADAPGPPTQPTQ